MTGCAARMPIAKAAAFLRCILMSGLAAFVMEYKSVDARVPFGFGSASRQELASWFWKSARACGLHIK
jgi:hypothetical protein